MNTVSTCFIFRSDSSPGKTYQTLLYIDGTTSCDCKGWTIKRNSVRSCRHTRLVEAGCADGECVSKIEYTKCAPQVTPGKTRINVRLPLATMRRRAITLAD